jgi:hypothetical protein
VLASIALHGTVEQWPETLALMTGVDSAEFVAAELRDIRSDGVVVIRAISVCLAPLGRWATAPPRRRPVPPHRLPMTAKTVWLAALTA